MFFLSTRRGNQFNSMVQESYDPLTGAVRDEVFLSAEDAREMGLEEGAHVLIESEAGELRGRVKIMPIRPRNVQVFWPEGNVLIKRGHRDPRSGVPDYNAMVRITPVVLTGNGASGGDGAPAGGGAAGLGGAAES